MNLDFHNDGTVTGLASNEFDLGQLGTVIERRRYSHIWPSTFWKRQAFKLLRVAFGERGPIASWCRSWKCTWQVRLVAAPRAICHTSNDRSECVEWERKHFVS